MIHLNKPALTADMLKQQLFAANQYMQNNNADAAADKIQQLADKLISNDFTIAFCGHFSAGKSRMINNLIKGELLPSSPIPTSANLVRVSTGDDCAKVFFKDGQPRLYQAPYDYQIIKNHCKDGDQIEHIDISRSDLPLPPHTTIMDTPGIDSADDAHRIATESAIHLADIIFYVMDYNHVQSELNFMFTRELTEAGKTVCLVINQIDKHSSNELSFTDFKQSVVNSFASWGVKPQHIFYTSLKDPANEHNQFPALEQFLTTQLQHKDELLIESIFTSLQKVLNDYCARQFKQADLLGQPYREILNELPADKQASLTDTYKSLLETKQRLTRSANEAEGIIDTGIDKIMSNAYLMPFSTRALAEAFLEASQDTFKVGFLFSRKKTAAEREARLNKFFADIFDKTKSQLEWHLRDFLIKFYNGHQLDDKELLSQLQQFTVDFSTELLISSVKPGARMSGDYVLNYTSDVANKIKQTARQTLYSIKTQLLNDLQQRLLAMQQRIDEQSTGLERYVRALEQITIFEADAQQIEPELIELLEFPAELPITAAEFFTIQPISFEVIPGGAAISSNTAAKAEAIEPITLQQTIAASAAKSAKTADATAETDYLKTTADHLNKAAQLIQPLPGFAKLSQELSARADRLGNKGFSVALFGAFSAGKSSFANALIGQRLLPVSPNPTTAAINKIKPVDCSHSHGTVIVQLKTEAAMLEDVNHALSSFEQQATSLDNAVTLVGQLNSETAVENPIAKTSYTFLCAFCRGYTAFTGKLGSCIATDVEEFGDYAALEEKSCFVNWIDIYYDCPLTSRGITLVDTPGADSINARHTGVAFDFIKNSDAILFVTYYNHAFSKADREFLIQLGRVKDSFQLDKMFFIINAIDLAESEPEKAAVADYVQQQLIKYGVKQPHLYPLSSLLALREKSNEPVSQPSGMDAFEASFYNFITHDLAAMTAAASEQELSRISQMVSRLIASTQEDVSVKARKKTNIEAEKTRLRELIASKSADSLVKRLSQEATELLYYIKQRVFFRFNEFFKEAFNPSVLRDDGRNLKKELHNSLASLLSQIGFDFAQEMRATTVRLDNFADKITIENQSSLSSSLREINNDLSFSSFEFTAGASMEFDSAFQSLPTELFKKSLGRFRSPKAFFEQQENQLMRDDMYAILDKAADEYLACQQQRLNEHYSALMNEQFAAMTAEMSEQAADFYASLLAALDGGVPVETLLKIKEQLPK